MSASTIAKNSILKAAFLLLGILSLAGCVGKKPSFEPKVTYAPSPLALPRLPSAFSPLTQEEKESDWGKELRLGLLFARDFDFYRALTCYKRARFLAPEAYWMEIDYHIVEAYFLGRKYEEALEYYEISVLKQAPLTFKPIKELLLMLYECYSAKGDEARACQIYFLLKELQPEAAQGVEAYSALKTADFEKLYTLASTDEELCGHLECYCSTYKSVETARLANALLPGAGYFYVGQKKTALTSFVINALFSYAAYECFHHRNVGWGLITASLEAGWYLGGINGAGLAANEWNERLYETHAREYLLCKGFFPSFMFSFAF